MHLLRGAVASLVCCAAVLTMQPPMADASDSATPTSSRGPSTYIVREGVTLNSPLGTSETKRAILDKILGAIRHTRPGGTLKIMTWNFNSPEAVTALLGAQDRGVVVRVLMDANNNDEDTDNPVWRRLRAGLKANNPRNATFAEKSVAKTCQGSCRGGGGASHAKFFLFPRVGNFEKVLIQGSANLTTAAAANQWNEIFTYVGRAQIYDFAEAVFDEMWLDKPVPGPFRSFDSGKYGLVFSPLKGSDYVLDPVQDTLNKVRCYGAVDAGNERGRTIVRSAPDVIRGQRGMTAARRLKELWDGGCDVRLVYTVIGKDVKRYLSQQTGRGPLPMRHLVQDFNGDGDFDNYFHLKVLTVNGVIGKNTTAYYAINGSSNTSDGSTTSDENIGTFESKPITLRYEDFINYWFDNPPADGTSSERHAPVADPYVNVDLD
ncbi:MAG: hypothetical protein F2667_02590 [Actinobacteria bacterium]|uniref:Unannotated protein n=1 Tax=freshwater metagenome TaxID=449393 RepID=A0A6J6P1S9_9ZZZZ|nr:hypothetical protein [Actinomycetota bacterium]